MQCPRLLLITDEAYSEEVVSSAVRAAASVLPPGWLAVQLRDKSRTDRLGYARRLRARTRDVGAALVINGDVGIARAVLADGVHFAGGATDREVEEGRGLWRSLAAHVDADVVRARGLGVDAVLVSPVFATPNKMPPRGVGAIRDSVARAGPVAVIALGGVSPANAAACFAAGATGVAVIRAVFEAADVGEVVRGLTCR